MNRFIVTFFVSLSVLAFPVIVFADTVIASPSSYDFEDITLGEIATKSFTITNLNPSNLRITIVILSSNGENYVEYTGTEFAITSAPSFPHDLAGDGQTEIDVTFSPTVIGTFSVYLYIYCTSGDPPEIFIPLSGRGVEESSNTAEFKLTGAEVIKGVDFGDIRYWTTFIGKVYEGSDALGFTSVGYWWTVIRHTDTENIEVCGGTNNLLKVNLVVVFESGALAGHKLVLGLHDPALSEDVVWDSMAPMCGPACYDDECICPNNPEEIEEWDCDLPMPNGYGPVATISGLELIEKFGSTLSIEEAYISGYLCHNWLYVPRVLTYLFVKWN
jgi:hypothetical protein